MSHATWIENPNSQSKEFPTIAKKPGYPGSSPKSDRRGSATGVDSTIIQTRSKVQQLFHPLNYHTLIVGQFRAFNILR